MNRDVQKYLAADSGARKKLFLRLEKIILGMYPRAAVGIAYGVPTYGSKPARVGLGYWRDGVSFYPYSGSMLDGFRKKYPTIKTTKGAVNFSIKDKVPVTELKKLIRQAMKRTPKT